MSRFVPSRRPSLFLPLVKEPPQLVEVLVLLVSVKRNTSNNGYVKPCSGTAAQATEAWEAFYARGSPSIFCSSLLNELHASPET